MQRSRQSQNGEDSLPPHEVYTSLLSHELRTPVTVILGYLQLLQDSSFGNNPGAMQKALETVGVQAERLARVVTELTTFSDLAAGNLRQQHPADAADLPAVVQALARGRAVRLEASADASSAVVDDERLQLILQVLLDNAFRFGAPGAEVLVRARLDEAPQRLVIWVVNEGEPIAEEQREAIFSPFKQVESHHTRRHGGLGLGLTVARRAAEGVGGTLALEPGTPTTFRVELPLREDPVAQQARELQERAALADAQTLQAIRDLRRLREDARRAERLQQIAEGQQLRAVQDFRAMYRHSRELNERLDTAYLETVLALARAVEARDGYTGGHVERVRRHSLATGSILGLDEVTLRDLEYGATLHDVGKIGVADTILRKPGPLDAGEWDLMREHPEIGRRMLEGVAFLGPALDAVACHHERWDGGGYPAGQTGNQIPLLGRIVAVADAYDAMTSDRPYRAGLPREIALEEIRRGRGTQFDPVIAEAFLSVLPHQ